MPLRGEGQDAAKQIREGQDIEKTGEVAHDRRLPADPATLEVRDAKAGQTLSDGRAEETLQDCVIGHPQQRQPRPVNGGLCRERAEAAATHRGRNAARDPCDTEGAVENGVEQRDDERVGDQSQNTAGQRSPGRRGEVDRIHHGSARHAHFRSILTYRTRLCAGRRSYMTSVSSLTAWPSGPTT